MKSSRLLLIGLMLCAARSSEACLGQTPATGAARADEVNVLEMKSVPDGHFLLNLHWEGRDRLLNIEVKDTAADCVNSDEARLKGLHGRFQLIGNGVFLISFQNEHHRASQFWLFRKDGRAAGKELPERGEEHVAAPARHGSRGRPRR